MKNTIQQRGVLPSKIAVIRNAIDTDFIEPLPKVNLFSKKYGIHQSFVVMYAGNIGLPHGVEVIIKSAELLRDFPEIVFCFVARGEKKEQIETMAIDYNLTNTIFIEPQPEKFVPLIWAGASVGIITYKKNLAEYSVPSKLFAMMCAARPVIASMDRDSEAGRIIEDANCGIVIEPEDEYALKDAILKLKHNSNRCYRMGLAGRLYAETKLHSEIFSDQYEKVLNSTIDEYTEKKP